MVVPGASRGEQSRALRSQPAAAGAGGRGAPRLLPRPSRRGCLAAGHGPYFVLIFRFICALSVFCHPPKRGNQTKECLYFFSGLVK